jgi:glycosyltransferase involved in cell wall biosynthesis
MFRICHFIHSDGAGGGPKVIRQLLQGLPAAEFQQSLVHGGNGALTQWCRENRVKEIEVPTRSVLSGLLGICSVVKAFKTINPDVIFLHGQWAGPLGAWAARWAKGPQTVYIAHCPAFYHSTSIFRAIRNYIAEKIPCSLCDRVVALSDGGYYNYLYRGWAPENHLLEIHNGVDPSTLPSAESVNTVSRRFSTQPGSRHAVFVGRIDDQKRVDWLLEAWHAALRSGFASNSEPQRWHLWIVGDGNERSKMEQLSRSLELRDSVQFVGIQTDAMAWIAASDLLILSSLYEGHALVPLEAMGCSKPVAAFYTDGVTDSVIDGETGLLAPLGDTHALGNNIARMLSSPEECRRMGTAGHHRMLAEFSVGKTIARYADLIRELVRNTGLADDSPQSGRTPHRPKQPADNE